MRQRGFVDRRQAQWQRLEALLVRVERRGVRGLPPDQIEELALLYRATTSDLATAQSRGYEAGLRGYLNRLTARAHAQVYAERSGDGWTRVAGFFAAAFPREVRRSWRAILGCSALFVGATIVAAWLVWVRPLDVYALLPASEVPLVQRSLHDSNFGFDRGYAPAISTAIITNNIEVSALAFAGGMTLGVVTVWAILNNGLMLGGLGSLFAHHGFGLDFAATIAPHGVFELTAIQIAGGAGLVIAGGIVAPGRRRRADALRLAARRAGTLLIGVAAMLVIAGLIEGFVTPQRISVAARFGVGALGALALLVYFGFAGRRADDQNAARSLASK